MRVELEDIMQNTENLASGLYSLSHLLEIVDNTEDQISLNGLAHLLGVVALAVKKQANDTQMILNLVEK
ncbi:hypothetical protein [Actinobacillus pleuropneumoniae]|uniref:hypothetical protein n=1 Tax=Actinobacillus pleuropneumoniae TaxID=715 RepID=UPI001F3A97B5|nr:hypothetical protein [Actinobacillus pleuropneumoniae]UKH19829.1 hypothetical protein D1109_01085 [Actinobacillus pleuropneumoniae]UPA21436.1 hypothetical protein JS559_02930 [Actinobacillus pleuropneumoniae]UPA21647.1 hypothetical protein JS559_04065 [Actinobacillus pleuropneumoniae]